MVVCTLYAWMIRFIMFLFFTIFISNISICNNVCTSIIKRTTDYIYSQEVTYYTQQSGNKGYIMIS